VAHRAENIPAKNRIIVCGVPSLGLLIPAWQVIAYYKYFVKYQTINRRFNKSLKTYYTKI
jgi:hypothetical protein